MITDLIDSVNEQLVVTYTRTCSHSAVKTLSRMLNRIYPRPGSGSQTSSLHRTLNNRNTPRLPSLKYVLQQ